MKSGKDEGKITLGEALSFGLSGAGEAKQSPWGAHLDTGLPVTGLEAEGPLREFIENLKHGERMEELSQPEDFRGRLRPYQVRGYSWLWFLRNHNIGACLADDMGLGKTIQVIALLLQNKLQSKLRNKLQNKLWNKLCTQDDGRDDDSQNDSQHDSGAHEGRRPMPVLLICPTSLVGNWQREISRFAPSLRVMIHHGMNRLTGEDFKKEAGDNDLVISTYSLARRDEAELAQVDWDGIILDEAQNIKNASAQQTQSIRRLTAGFRVALTGTPVENRLSELWSIMEFLNPGYLGSLASFRERFSIPVERYGDHDAAERLRRLVTPFILRRLKTDPRIIQDLPEKQEMKVYCNLTKEQATLYEAMVRDMMMKIEGSSGIERKGAVLAALTKLKQVADHPALFLGDNSVLDGRSGKLARLREMLEEISDSGERAIIFTQFARMGEMLRDYLQDAFDREVFFLHGGTDRRMRDQMVERFQGDPDAPFAFVMSLKAGGVGLNLVRANHVFHFDRWWNPAVENQATDRVFRIGQTRTVQVHKFLCAGTVEERIDELIESKKALAKNIIGTGENWITEMTTEELNELFRLNWDAVSEE
ncbi:MAG: DEAD/DEAH box helicase [Firmicutes bacterium]|nr:DEAD/DEAH box helicase [Bacillota bacterium]